jgi:hypothetical protein
MKFYICIGSKLESVHQSKSLGSQGQIHFIKGMIPAEYINVLIEESAKFRSWDRSYQVTIRDSKDDGTRTGWSCFTDGSLNNRKSEAGGVILRSRGSHEFAIISGKVNNSLSSLTKSYTSGGQITTSL